jgi:hypothetical protein
MRQLTWLLELPANNVSLSREFVFVVEPALERVIAIHALGWRLASNPMPAQVKVEFSDTIGSGLPTAMYSRAVAASSATPTIICNRGLLFQPNSALTYDSQEYETPRPIAYANISEGVRGLTVRVTDFDGAVVGFTGKMYIELLLTIDDGKGHDHYLTPDKLNEAQRKALDGYFIESGKRPRV